MPTREVDRILRRIRKVVLTIPNFLWHKSGSTVWMVHPYNICLLAAMIKDEYEIAIVDANVDKLSLDDFAAAIEREKPDLVGITVLTDEFAGAGHLAAKVVKEIDAEIVVIMGGVYVTSSPRKAIADENVDYVLIGEGEHALGDFLGFLNGKNNLPSRGMGYRANGETIIQERVPFIRDLDALPYPAYELVDYTKYSMQPGRYSVDNPRDLPYTRMFTSRGCGIGCIFCQVEKLSGKRFRYRSPENVLNEMEFMKKRYGLKALVFDDDNFFIKRSRAKKILELMIERNLDLKWSAIAVPVFLLDEDLIDIMSASGCRFIDLAIESGSQRVLKEIIRKPVDLKKATKIIDKALSWNIDVACNFIVGLPGETWEEIRQTLRFAEECNIDYAKIFIANPLPGTKMEKLAMDMGVLTDPNGEMTWKYGKIRTDEFSPQDLAILRAYEWDRINFKTPEKRKKIARMMRISEEELEEIRRETRRSLDFS